MHRSRFFIITFIGIFIIGVAATVLTNLLTSTPKVDLRPIQKSLNQFGFGIARLIANSGFTEDAYLLKDPLMLGEYNIRFKRSSPYFRKITFLDSKGKIISSSDTSLIGKLYPASAAFNTLKSKGKLISNKGDCSIFGSEIKIDGKIYGYVIVEVRSKIPQVTFAPSGENLPMKFIPGIVLALIGGMVFGFVVMAVSNRIAEDVAEELSTQQELIFSPKVKKLKEEFETLRAAKEEIESKIKTDRTHLEEMKRRKEDLDHQLREHPVVKSIDKLRESEAKLMEGLRNLKDEKEKLDAEIKKLETERDEIMRKIEADRQEEKKLHERLELIKKKILKLE